MEQKPRVGLVWMRADWTGCEPAERVVEKIEGDAVEVVRRLEGLFDIRGPWVVDSRESLADCQNTLCSAEVDMILLAYQTWAEDGQLRDLLEAVGNRPLVLWCYLPWRRMPRPGSYAEVMRGSGPVGAFGALGTLRNLDVPFLFIFGAPDDPRLMQDLRVAGRAAAARQALREARLGMLPERNTRMQSSLADDERLMTDFGSQVINIPVDDYLRAMEALPAEQVSDYLSQLRARCPISPDVSDAVLERGARAALGLGQIAAEHRLNLLAVNDATSDLLTRMGMRPALYPDLPNTSQVLYQPEGDLGAAAANLVLNRLTGSPTLFLELWYWDEAKNQVVGGHSGLQNPAVGAQGRVWVGQDYKYCHTRRPGDGPVHPDWPGPGAQFQMIARPGRVTLFQLRSTPFGWQAIALSGICLEGQPWVDSHPHALVRLDPPIEHFFSQIAEVGVTQHWIMAYGSVLSELEAFCEMENIPLEVIR